MNDTPKNHWFINSNSYISVSIVVLIIGATIWLSNGQTQARQLATDVKNELEHYKEIQKLNSELITTKLDNLAVLYKDSMTSKYTEHDHEVFVERLRELNPGMKVPK